MIVDDRRNEDERMRLTVGVVGTDRFMSGWGLAKEGASYACWACDADHLAELYGRIASRGDMKRVRVVDLRTYRPRGAAHMSIYAYDPGSPPL